MTLSCCGSVALQWPGNRERKTMDDELEAFKNQIDLREYAADQGYKLDRKESWRGSSVMRRGGDKIIIKRNGNGHYVYFSVRDDLDNGSIIDFIQKRQRLSLGNVRKELRQWAGRPPSPLPLFPALEKTTRDRLRVETEYRRMQEASRHPYLEQERCLPAPLLASPRFAGRIRIDARGNAVFPHFDEKGLCGYELKNRGFTGFAKGGEKGLWFSRTSPEDQRLILAESAIDALSYAVLFPDSLARYASIGGSPNPKQPGLIQAALLKMPAGSEIVSAMDHDEAGQVLTALIQNAVTASGRQDIAFRIHSPEQQDADWNQVLQDRCKPSFPMACSLNP